MKSVFLTPFVALLSLSCAGADGQPLSVGAPEVIGEGAVSTNGAEEIKLAVSPDGRQQLWGAVGRSAPGKLDIWERHRVPDGSWSVPAPLAINGPGEDFDPAFSPDGTKLYFHSNRPGGYGRTDIYVADREGEFGFSQPRNLGPSINSEGAEWAPWALPDGRVLFASDGWGGEGRHDIFIGHPGSDGAPRNFGGVINGPLSEFDPTLSADGRSIFFSRGLYGPDGEDFSVWRSDRTDDGKWQVARPVDIGCGSYTIGLAFLPDGSFTYSSRCSRLEEGRMLIMRISRDELDSAS